MNKGINVFSGFDGISCCHLGLDRVGIKVQSYMASELLMIPKGKKGGFKPNPSVLITQYNYPETIQLGDIRLIDGNPLRGLIDLFVGGSPCQSFSNAGPRNGFNGKSGLFWEWVRLWKEIQPEFWLLENVEMKKEWEDIISEELGVFPYHINSDLVSGQNRPRVYWTNIPYTPITDKEIMLSDQVLGAVRGTNTHGKPIGPNPTKPGKFLYKHNGWEDFIRDKGCCLVRGRGHYRNIQGDVKGYIPEDAEALQNITKGYTNVPGVCNTSRHEVLGNAMTVDVLVEAFFKNLPWVTKSVVSTVNKIIV